MAAMEGGIFSTGVVEEVLLEAQDCGELAVVEPGDEAWAWAESVPPFSEPEPDAFSAFRHFALRFWNQNCTHTDTVNAKFHTCTWRAAYAWPLLACTISTTKGSNGLGS